MVWLQTDKNFSTYKESINSKLKTDFSLLIWSQRQKTHYMIISLLWTATMVSYTYD